MQQYGKKTKRRREITLFLSYALMTIAVIAISVVCILLAMGYRFNFERKQIEQGALVQFASNPSGASVVLDGERLSFTTSGKRYVEVGEHMAVIHREGYRDWSKQFSIRPGEVRWLNYARLVPSNVETRTVKELESVSSSLPSPSRRYIALIANPASPEVTFIDFRDTEKPVFTPVSISSELLTMPEGATHSFTVVEWNLASKFVMIRHDFGSGSDYIRVNVEDTKDIVNLSKKFGVVLSSVHFSDGNNFYGVENGNLRRFDVGSGSLSEPIAGGVVDMKVHGSKNLVFVRHVEKKYEVVVRIDDSQKTVAAYDDTLPVLFDVGEYFNEFYLAVSQGAAFELIKNPEKTSSKSVVALTFPNHPDWLDISSNGRFVIFGDEHNFVTYDIELRTKSEVHLADPLVKGLQPQWLDDYLLVSVTGGKLSIRDFDGDNRQVITEALAGQPVMLTSDNSLLYSFSRNEAGVYGLQASRMIVKP